jgi:hypothetical protein
MNSQYSFAEMQKHLELMAIYGFHNTLDCEHGIVRIHITIDMWNELNSVVKLWIKSYGVRLYPDDIDCRSYIAFNVSMVGIKTIHNSCIN